MSSLKDYIAIARPDHWFKNIFVLPGALFACYFTRTPIQHFIAPLALALVAACLIASANYVINEWLDAAFDQYHPVKKYRPSVCRQLSKKVVYLEYALLALCGLGLASLLSRPFFLSALSLLIMGALYNIRPFRSKDRLYLDVLSESINNPIRLYMGWFAVTTALLPPSSLVIGYWMSGAFLMAMKRFAEFRFLNNPEQAGLYRRSFRYYTEEKLLISSFFYAMCSGLFLGVFLIKHRVEFIFLFPFLAVLYSWYFHLALQPDSLVQNPEKLYRDKIFLLYVGFFGILVGVLLFVDVAFMNWFLRNAFAAI